MDSETRTLRYQIFALLLQTCRPPTIPELVSATATDNARVLSGLQTLQGLHHITLYADDVISPSPIAMAHPFSHIPTPYIVTTGTRSWYANCAWCAFGLAAMLSPASVTLKILSPSNGGEFVTINLANGEILDPRDYYITFSPPPSTWWNDVRFACSSIQLCTSKQDAEGFFARSGWKKGDILDLATLWRLAKAWYHDKHIFEYERKTPNQARELFVKLGMTADYWTT